MFGISSWPHQKRSDMFFRPAPASTGRVIAVAGLSGTRHPDLGRPDRSGEWLTGRAGSQLRRNVVRMPKSRSDGEGKRQGYIGFITGRHRDSA
jgi:hypothetical protein